MNKIAIIMSLYNRVHLTEQTINNLFDSAGVSFDLFFVDDNSTDSTFQYIKNLQPDKYCTSISYIKNDSNLGKAKNINSILRDVYSKEYDYFCVLDNDILLPKSWLSTSISILKHDPFVGICSVLVEPNLIKDNPTSFNFEKNYINTALMGGACLIWGSYVKEHLGLFCTDYGRYGHEDADFTFRCRFLGKKTVFLHNLGSHIGEDNLLKDDPYRKMKTFEFEKSKSLLFTNIEKYCNNTKTILIK
jgi:GT2 family glycosyltransferase